jgi:hypothetical protein
MSLGTVDTSLVTNGLKHGTSTSRKELNTVTTNDVVHVCSVNGIFVDEGGIPTTLDAAILDHGGRTDVQALHDVLNVLDLA